MVGRIEHIGIITKDVEASMNRFRSLLGLEVKNIEELKVENAMIKIAFLPVGEINIELIQPTAKTALNADFLQKEGDSIHHIAFEVEDLEKTFNELRSQGVEFIWDRIIEGSRGSKVAFFRAEEFNGIYIEIVEKN